MVTINHLVTGRHRDFLLVTYRDSRILLTNKLRRNQQLKIVVQHLASVMLTTTLCWWLYDGNRFKMLVTESICWKLFALCWLFLNVSNYHYFRWVTNIPKLSPTHFVSNILGQRPYFCHRNSSRDVMWNMSLLVRFWRCPN